MKRLINYSLGIVLLGGLTFSACNKDEDTPVNPAISVSSITSGATDLYGATAATGVSETESIIITFSTTVDASSLGGITLVRGNVDVDIAATASGTTVTVDPTDDLLSGTNYTLTISGVKSDKGELASDATTSFTTQGVGLDTPPQKDAQVLYLPLNGSIFDVTGTSTGSFEQVSYTADRFGNANAAASFGGATAAGNGDIVELTGSGFVNPSTTISLWFKVNSADYAAGSLIMFGVATERGYFMEMGGDLAWTKFATSHALSPDPNSHYFGTAWTDPNGDGSIGGQVLYDYTGSIKDLIGDNQWAQLVMTHDGSTATKTIYFNGVKAMQVDLDAETTEWYLKDLAIANKADGTGDAIAGIDPVLTLGYFCSRANTATGWSDYSAGTNTFKGLMDDFRIFDIALTESEVSQLYNSEKN
ncbi:MAG: Ig-like domain-containing protein [Fimbriimonadaceae bacterium]|nr:Ig-like domain-containing protein [Chitinophagales bacterium]